MEDFLERGKCSSFSLEAILSAADKSPGVIKIFLADFASGLRGVIGRFIGELSSLPQHSGSMILGIFGVDGADP